MSKKHHKQKEQKEQPKKAFKETFLDIHWDKIIISLLFIIPLIYFAQFLSPNTMIGGRNSDYVIGDYTFEKYAQQNQKDYRELPLWYPDVFGGFPVLSEPIVGYLRPSELLFVHLFLTPPQIAFVIELILYFFIAGLGMYLYVKKIGLSKYSAAIAAIAYQFMGNLATTPLAGHPGRAASIVFFPFILFWLHLAFESKKIHHFVWLAIFTTLGFFREGTFQITYYSIIFIFIYSAYYLISHRKVLIKKDYLKIFSFSATAIVLICLLYAYIWLPVIHNRAEAARGVQRGYEYAASWAMPPVEIFDLFVPQFSGGMESYWGPNAVKLHTEYFGIIALVFALFAIVHFWRKPYLKFYLITAFIALLYCFGSATPVHRIFYTVFPGFKLMRAPSLAFYLVGFSFITMAAIGFESLVVNKELTRKKFVTTGILILAAFIVLLLVLAPALGKSSAGPKLSLYETNFSSYMNGVLIALFVTLLALIGVLFAINQRVSTLTITAMTMLLIIVTQIPVMHKFLPKGAAPEQQYAADDAVRFLKTDKTIFRVFPLYYEHSNDTYLQYYNIQSAGGYIANPIQRYQDFIGAGNSTMFNPVNLIQYPRFADILNIKYVIAPNLPDDISRYDANSQRIISDIANYLKRLRLVSSGYEFSVFQSDSALPRAYIVPDYQVAPDENALGVLRSPAFDPRTTVLLAEDPGVVHPEGKPAMVVPVIKNYSANRIVIETECPHDGFLVLADNWHPDWQVRIDKQKAECLRANYTFRAVYVSAGKHEVIFEYKSVNFAIGLIITIVTLCAILGFYIPLTLWKFAVKLRISSAKTKPNP